MTSLARTTMLALLWSVVTGCAAAPGGEPRIVGTQWALVAADRGALASHATGSGVTLAFDAARVSGYSGCNRYSGDYTLVGTELRVGALTRTKRGCMDAAGAVEAAWFAALEGASLQLSQAPNSLALTTADGLQLRFEPGSVKPEP